jgi:predicted nucleotidyltransferase
MSILTEILSSKARAEVFRLLFSGTEEELHMREIQRRAGLNDSTIRQELRRLVRLDLILSRKDSNRIYYTANKHHPLYSEIRNIVLKTIGLADLIKEALLKSSEIKIAFVFGSIARNDENAKSDVDLIVIGDVGLRKVTTLLSGMASKIGREINPHVFTQEEFTKRKAKHEHFITRVLQEQKIFIIGNENDLAEMV